LSQQPLQVAGPHAAAWQLCPTHCWPVAQATQAAPPLPQTAGLLPGMQAPL
jgi:hypothetical protein